MKSVEVNFYLYSDGGNRDGLGKYSLDESTTYEEIIHMLTQKQVIPPVEPPLHYDMVVFIWETGTWNSRRGEKSALLREGQTLASITRLTGERILFLTCHIYVSSLPNQTSRSAHANLGETITSTLTSREATAIANLMTIATGLTAFIGALRLVGERWSKKQNTGSESDIVAIHLWMTHGDDHEFEEWLTDPDRLKHYIDVFNQPTSSIHPLQAIFVQRNGKALKVDVSEGAQNNLQLDEMLTYLKNDSTKSRTALPPTPSSPTPSLPHLKSSYSGTYTGVNDSSSGTVTLLVTSQDQQGNIVATLNYNNGTTLFQCQGTVTSDGHLTLNCNGPTLNGLVYPDGHIEGIESFSNGSKYKNILR